MASLDTMSTKVAGKWSYSDLFLLLLFQSSYVPHYWRNRWERAQNYTAHLVVLFIVLNEYSYYAKNVSLLSMKPLAIISFNKIVTVTWKVVSLRYIETNSAPCHL